MNFDIFEFTSRVQITTALVLIVFLLAYIAFYKTPFGPLQKKLPLDK